LIESGRRREISSLRGGGRPFSHATRHPPQSIHTDGGEDKNLAALGFAKLALMFAGWYLANIYFNM
jgi:hypothetical protein